MVRHTHRGSTLSWKSTYREQQHTISETPVMKTVGVYLYTLYVYWLEFLACNNVQTLISGGQCTGRLHHCIE